MLFVNFGKFLFKKDKDRNTIPDPMNTLFKLAWRNIWRNKRRTYITTASIFFAVVLAAFMQSIQKGAWDHMIDSVVNSYFGYAEIHSQGYEDEQTIDKAFPFDSTLQNIPQTIPSVESVVPRLTSFALASHRLKTRGVMVVGTAPQLEHQMTQLAQNIVEGHYFEGDEPAVLIVEGVAKSLEVGIGDTLVLISQGYHGVNAAGKYAIKGILHFASPILNKQMVFLPLPVAQELYGASGLITRLSLNINDKKKLPRIVSTLRKKLGDQYEVMQWDELMPELAEAREVDTAGNYLVMLILYLIIGFGIFGTILMMTKEREYEFGVLVAIGMKRRQLGIVIWLEVIMLGLLGAMIGILGSIPLVAYFHHNPLNFSHMEGMADAYEKFGFAPIFPAAFEAQIFFTHALVIFLVTSVLAAYPLFKIQTLMPVKAMRG
ncbi:MAG: ABC transporter permease [Bacteroidetes bacterium]|nr:MAG: ABC transporter permease [Bacteroidota bacterium]